jgi:hypothetical protein
MIMVTPTQTKGILPAFLDLACAVSQLPIGTLFCEEEVAGRVWTDKPDCSFLEIQRVSYPFCVIGEISFPGAPDFAHLDHCLDTIRVWGIDKKSAVAKAFYAQESAVFFIRKEPLSQTGSVGTLDLG